MRTPITGIFVAPEKKPEWRTVENELEPLKELIECEYIYITWFDAGGRRYRVVCDDMGLINERPVSIGVRFMPIHGPAFIVKEYCDDITSLDAQDVEILREECPPLIEGLEA